MAQLNKQEEIIQKRLSKASEILQQFERTLRNQNITPSVRDLLFPEETFKKNVLVEKSKTIKIAKLDFTSIRNALIADFSKLSIATGNQLSSQFERQEKSIQSFREKYGVYPEATDKNITLSEVANSHQQLMTGVKKLKNSQAQLVHIQNSFDEYLALKNRKMDELWKSIQNSDKYHNDNGRYRLAVTAIILSIVAMLLSMILFGVSFSRQATNNYIIFSSELTKQDQKRLEGILKEIGKSN